MAASKTYVVPVDFSRQSSVALKHAVALSRQSKGKLVLVHVIPTPLMAAEGATAAYLVDYYEIGEKSAREQVKKLARRYKLKPKEYRFVVIRGGDAAQKIAAQAKKARAAMIVMGSHGRTGLKRFMLGSVAERTLRYASCPVLIVKR